MRSDTLIISLAITMVLVTMLFGVLHVQDVVQPGAALSPVNGTTPVATVRQPCLNGAYLPVNPDTPPLCPPWRPPADII